MALLMVKFGFLQSGKHTLFRKQSRPSSSLARRDVSLNQVKDYSNMLVSRHTASFEGVLSENCVSIFAFILIDLRRCR